MGSRMRSLMAIDFVAVLAFVAPQVGTVERTGTTGEAVAIAVEEQGLELQALVESKQALGIYRDDRTGEFVIVVSSFAHGTIDLISSASGPAGVRVKTSELDQETVDRIGDAILAKRGDLKEYSLGFGFDPETGTVLLRSEAPESAFSSILDQFPGKVTFREAKFELTNATNDPQPHSGGADLNGSLSCTSGFTLKFNNNNARSMVTAGHCNPNGASTNMGAVWRDPEVYPYWDFELVYGHSYQGRIYDSLNYTRPVVNASNPSIGASYCTRGRTSGTVCGYIVRKLNQTICYLDYPGCAHNLAEFYRSDGKIPQPGDSGGPLFFSYSSPLRAGIRGVVSGRSWDLFQGWSGYATQYETIAAWYVGQAVLSN